MSVIAKITSKGQTTIPQEIRELLHVKPGDFIIWESISNDTVQVRRAQALDRDYLSAVESTLNEWSGDADEAAYRDL